MRTMRFSLTLPLSLWCILFFINGLNAALEPSVCATCDLVQVGRALAADVLIERTNFALVFAQTEAVCQDNFGWMNNSRTQSPCLVAAYLEGACGTGCACCRVSDRVCRRRIAHREVIWSRLEYSCAPFRKHV
ncbi:hypothetical protein M407DRAFT_207556 [Tulasnella calospora MUT 4182]|uniref:Uncharacterized protein n=1 Tax=Tulasnella calospora MUT 4182 TaxID=1051891 RepID=A0A0C3QIH7_9AGAM|nr:hypothetical protein M407DRAFT_207556 [Tulasnella calospora MUT 4182]